MTVLSQLDIYTDLHIICCITLQSWDAQVRHTRHTIFCLAKCHMYVAEVIGSVTFVSQLDIHLKSVVAQEDIFVWHIICLALETHIQLKRIWWRETPKKEITVDMHYFVQVWDGMGNWWWIRLTTMSRCLQPMWHWYFSQTRVAREDCVWPR